MIYLQANKNNEAVTSAMGQYMTKIQSVSHLERLN